MTNQPTKYKKTGTCKNCCPDSKNYNLFDAEHNSETDVWYWVCNNCFDRKPCQKRHESPVEENGFTRAQNKRIDGLASAMKSRWAWNDDYVIETETRAYENGSVFLILRARDETLGGSAWAVRETTYHYVTLTGRANKVT